ncbi:MAG: type toxin-antitoxin system HipA family toxin [Microbacterium sp.]|jgi:serine/threonine-protein kinase HipA|nr:type toxin-antitoxin system HipA family toxin [Microbacterium sp.]
MKLAIELYGTLIGHLEGPDARSFDFVGLAEAAETFGANSRVLSIAMPLVRSLPRHHAGRRRNWFGELLPEGDQLDYMLGESGIRRGDVPSFLARYGRDVAGALQIWDVDDPSEPRDPGLLSLDPRGVRELLENPLRAPLANAPGLGKSSLGGIQPKIVLAHVDATWNQVVGGYPSTHILKPQLEKKPTVIFDEEYGSRLARGLGLAHFETRIEVFDGLSALVIERFDRADGSRVHQEDFNQALGASGSQKYQEFGGVVSLQRVAQALRSFAGAEDLRALGRMMTLGLAIGNLDMHTKNLGLLHPASGEIALAPAYDVVPMSHHVDADGKLALAINGKYRHVDVTTDDLIVELRGWGARRAEALVQETLEELHSLVRSELPLEGSHRGLHDDILRFVGNLCAGRAVGAS